MGVFNEPFRGSRAMADGLLTRGQVRSSRFRRLFPDIYLAADIAPTLAIRSRGAQLLVAGHGLLAGYSAAELLGARIAPRDADAEVVVPGGEFRLTTLVLSSGGWERSRGCAFWSEHRSVPEPASQGR